MVMWSFSTVFDRKIFHDTDISHQWPLFNCHFEKEKARWIIPSITKVQVVLASFFIWYRIYTWKISGYSRYIQSCSNLWRKFYPISVCQWNRYIVNTISDIMLQKLLKAHINFLREVKWYCTSSWPYANELPMKHRIYAPVQSALTVSQRARLIIQVSKRIDRLSKIHEGHLGANKCMGPASEII